ncbi:Glucans biosynthesis glucosyltransferase H [Rubripirellula lacrimiformis]|uniref:Glucans biosynthesis glucosyltransferase H n=1 Tax=Rubripirellula lacrimiformis TaxID=1930273 RepID=A0A517N556_9BACT|nr:glucans biosynthesis glucosyltransferase MdoH [Rubripirellula lacrimiformis]QDT02241.1 Glucans biosynthesis glucosyltransferase H [Rubripirellula lacrimiformis]
MNRNPTSGDAGTRVHSTAKQSPRAVRWWIASLTVVGTAAGIAVYAANLAAGGWNPFEVAAFPLFAILFGWIVFSFLASTVGFISAIGDRSTTAPVHPPAEGPTAVLVPIYNESPDDVFARVAAMVMSLREQDHQLGCDRASDFHFYILSDTTDPEVWLAEELAWSRLNQQLTSDEIDRPPHVYYRHRSKNIARKAGNIADFCERWSAPYSFMIVLDADSLLEPATMVAMVDTMAADPKLGILQVPPTPIGRESYFARLQQFSAAAYGQISCRGFDAWAGSQGNYWGHNAILRVDAFCESCDLPLLPGKAPLGGEILSHDFVEAALMVRDGWNVRLANHLGGSYEECPTTLTDYAMRDQRWCQGNLQHSRLILSEGFHPASRLHFFSGVLAYAASPIWLLWTALAVAGWFIEPAANSVGRTSWLPSQFALFLIAMSFLLIPKLYGVIAIIAQSRSDQFGGPIRLALSALLETCMSILLSPLMAVLHSRFVITTLLGRQVRWNAQNRGEQGVSLTAAATDYGVHTLLGIAVATVVFIWATPLTWWMAPLVAGLILAIPLAMMLGSRSIGQLLSRWGLLRIPQEAARPQVSRLQQQTLASYTTAATDDDMSRFERLLTSPSFYKLHDRVLDASDSNVEMSQTDRDQILQAAHRSIAEIPHDQRRAILSDRQLLQQLHAIAQLASQQPTMNPVPVQPA